jgi:hypothetical protein
MRAVKRFFDWCDEHHLRLEDIGLIAVAAYIEELGSGIGKRASNSTWPRFASCSIIL